MLSERSNFCYLDAINVFPPPPEEMELVRSLHILLISCILDSCQPQRFPDNSYAYELQSLAAPTLHVSELCSAHGLRYTVALKLLNSVRLTE